MIDSNYYKNYKGPSLVKATLNNKDFFSTIKEYYGIDNNWNGKLYKYRDIFTENDISKKIYCEFKSDSGRIHWFYGYIDDLNQYFNPPLAMNQL